MEKTENVCKTSEQTGAKQQSNSETHFIPIHFIHTSQMEIKCTLITTSNRKCNMNKGKVFQILEFILFHQKILI